MGWFRADRGFRNPYVLVFCGVLSLPAPGVHGYARNKDTQVQLEASRPVWKVVDKMEENEQRTILNYNLYGHYCDSFVFVASL